MANNAFRDPAKTFETGLVNVAGKVSLTTSGVPISDGIKACSASLPSAGVYRFTFDGSYAALLHASFAFEYPANGSFQFKLSGSNLTPSVVNNQPARSVDVYAMTGSNGALTSLPSGSFLYASFLLKNSSV
jgi:hypothetical protein